VSPEASEAEAEQEKEKEKVTAKFVQLVVNKIFVKQLLAQF